MPTKPEPKPTPAPQAAPKVPRFAEQTEKLLTLRATVTFSDGNLREFFEQYGYECEWKMNEVRKIPLWLAQRCVQSGAEIERDLGQD